MRVPAGDRQIRVDLGHLLFVSALGIYCIWFLFDARASSTNIQNLVLIQPAVFVAVLLCILIVAREAITVERGSENVQERSAPAAAPSPEKRRVLARFARWDALRLPLFMLLLVLYVGSIEVVGFDLSSFVFITASLLLQGERRLAVVLLLPLGFTALLVLLFKGVLLVPIHTVLG